jgi:hypothetical protein
LNTTTFWVHPGEGIEVAPGQLHQAINRSHAPVRFVVTSQPPSHDDRIEDAASSATDDATITALILKMYRQMMAGKVDPTLLTPQLYATLTPEIVTQAQALFTTFGEPTKLTLKSRQPTATGTGYVYAGSFPTSDFQVVIDITTAGKISGYRLAP